MGSNYIRVTILQFMNKMLPVIQQEQAVDEVGRTIQPKISNALGFNVYFHHNGIDYVVEVIDERKYMMFKLKHGF